jgi:hypothetical protein
MVATITTVACYTFIGYWTAKGLMIMFTDYFVRRTRLEAITNAHEKLTHEYYQLLKQWNTLVGQINARGGLTYLNKPPPAAITKEDVKILLQLCHPDKHQGRQIAQQMTAKLLSMREKL